MNTVLAIVLFTAMLIPLFFAVKTKKPNMKKTLLYINIASVFVFCVIFVAVSAAGVYSVNAAENDPTVDSTAADSAAADSEAVADSTPFTVGKGLGMIGVALSTGLACIGAGMAVSASASAAIGAVSENSKNFGKAIIFVAMGEGVALYGMLISIQLLPLLR
jgi:V/A-type H+-transporting ATPase subunit K